MKKILFSFTVIAVLLSACTVNEQKEQPAAAANGVVATFRQPVIEGVTKAIDSDLKFVFEEGDQINVYSAAKNECMVYGLTPSAESDGEASFVVKGFNLKNATYRAVYPYMRPSLDPESIRFSLAGQNQSANGDASHLSAYDLNYAQAEIADNSGTFAFEHQVAWLKIQIQDAAAAETYKEVVVSADEGIANELTLDAVSGTVDATPASADETMTLTLNGGNGIDVAEGGSLVAYVTIPAGEYTNLHIVCGNYARTIEGAKLREAGHVYPINLYTKLSKPTASPAPGDYLEGYVITLKSAEGADIYYTLDGTTPTEASTLYTSEGIALRAAYTIKAIAVKDGWLNSDVMTASYTITKAPAPKITIDDNGEVTITSNLFGSLIYYTTDGSHPTRSSAEYNPADRPKLTVGEKACVRAIVTVDHYSDSDEGYCYYNHFGILDITELEKFTKNNILKLNDVIYHGIGEIDHDAFEMKYSENTQECGHISCNDKNYRIKSIKIITEHGSDIKIYASEKTLYFCNKEIATVQSIYSQSQKKAEAYYEFGDDVDYHTVEIKPTSDRSVAVLSVTIEFR